MKIVLVEWVDSFGRYGWITRSEAEECKPSKCISTGLLVHETTDAMTLTTSQSDHGNVDNVITIPKCAITRIRTLKVAK